MVSYASEAAAAGAGSRHFPQQSKFAEAAAHIGRSIFAVTDKLEKLTKRMHLLFSFHAKRVHLMCHFVTQ
jgi:hypothetical protein